MNNKQWKYLRTTVIIVWILTAHERGLAQAEPSLEGTWVNEASTRKAEFYSQGGAWFGKIIWVKDDSKVKVGDILFQDLTWDGGQFKGRALTPRGAVNCVLILDGNDKIQITASRGGMSRSVYWTRVK